MRVAVIKPDWRIRGGGELAVDLVQAVLQQSGHDVDRLALDIPGQRQAGSIFGHPVSADMWGRVPEFFDFMAAAEAFGDLDLAWYDFVVSTQPPSYAVSHPRHLAFFLHHQRHFYDLSDVWVAAGFADAATHLAARDRVRAADDRLLNRVKWFAPISETVKRRLAQFNEVTTSTVVHLPPMMAAPPRITPLGDIALCVSRHEFPKRTELVATAGALVDRTPVVLAGSGGRLDLVRKLADSAGDHRIDWASLDASRLWLSSNPQLGRTGRPARNVRVAGRVTDRELAELYDRALCIVAPAFDEDYGLTVLEAMLHGRPVVVCSDGGGLLDFVDPGVTGLVVDPHPVAIADAVRELAENPERAADMGQVARRRVREFTLDRFRVELGDAVDRVLGVER